MVVISCLFSNTRWEARAGNMSYAKQNKSGHLVQKRMLYYRCRVHYAKMKTGYALLTNKLPKGKLLISDTLRRGTKDWMRNLLSIAAGQCSFVFWSSSWNEWRMLGGLVPKQSPHWLILVIILYLSLEKKKIENTMSLIAGKSMRMGCIVLWV